jgi:hypothetical protein
MRLKAITGILLTLMVVLFSAALSLLAIPTKASPGITPYFDNLAGFNAAAGSPPIVVDFDSIAPNTDITGLTFSEITFNLGNQPAPSAQLVVVRAADTYSTPGFNWYGPDNRLYATSGENVLSPGGVELRPGPDPLFENDDLMLVLSPVRAIGFDILYQSLDGQSCTAIAIFDGSGNVLYNNNFIPIPGDGGQPPGGTTFVGFVSNSPNIAKIIIDEFDENELNPDSNIGFDSIRIAATATVGGILVPIDKFGLLAPYIGLALTILVTAVASTIYVKRRKRSQ